MRKLLCLLIALMLLPVFPAFADETAQSADIFGDDTDYADEESEEAYAAGEKAAEDFYDSDTKLTEWAQEKRGDYKRVPDHIEIVPWDELPPVADGQHHYLLLCIDKWIRDPRPGNAHPDHDLYGNTDGIVLVTLDTRTHRIMLTSFIRDQIVRKLDATDENEKFTKINRIYNDMGPEALCRVISQHIGVRVEKYILFTFKQIANIIDYLGGVDIELTAEEIRGLRQTVLRGTVTDQNGVDIMANGIHPAGLYTFRTTEWGEEQNKTSDATVLKRTGGCSAVLYMRIRKFGGGGDFMRTQRARTVLSLLADKCRAMTWDDAKALANSILENSNMTNMNLDEMLAAAEQAFSLRSCTIEELRIPVDGAVRPIGFSGASQEVNWPVCREAMYDFLQNSWLVMDEEDD